MDSGFRIFRNGVTWCHFEGNSLGVNKQTQKKGKQWARTFPGMSRKLQTWPGGWIWSVGEIGWSRVGWEEGRMVRLTDTRKKGVYHELLTSDWTVGGWRNSKEVSASTLPFRELTEKGPVNSDSSHEECQCYLNSDAAFCLCLRWWHQRILCRKNW